MKKRLSLLVGVVLTATALTAQNGPTPIDLTPQERQMVRQNNGFALRLFDMARLDKNMVMSPLSITYALSLLANGAAGQTQQEILQALGFQASQAEVNAFCRKMLTGTATADELTTVNTASTIFVNRGKGFELLPGFVQVANEWYDAQPQNRDFSDGQTLDVINQWASDHTEGMITQVLDEMTFKPWAVSYLLNAIFFKGQWTYRFDVEDTTERPFGPNGSPVKMMQLLMETGGYTENDTYQALSLPYGHGAYHMTVLLPREGKDISDVMPLLSDMQLPVVGDDAEVDLWLPRFDITTNLDDLRPYMVELGMSRAFSEFDAEFPYFCNYNVFVEMMKQVARIEVNEEGTRAAAVTVVGVETSAMPNVVRMHADRPFLYVITEQSSGAILFIGQYVEAEGGSGAEIPSAIAIRPDTQPHPAALYDLQGRRVSGPASRTARGLYIRDGKKVLR